jgi:N5-(cytidine 5'-diphosphoramidyl)-L-glutamine hydrolase
MKLRARIGITQRVEPSPGSHELRDCLDQRWVPLLESLGLLPIPLANRTADPKSYIEALALDGLILSGGNDLSDAPGARSAAPERDRLERAALAWALAQRRPVLGVCRGMQAINVFLGGQLVPVTGHAGTRHAVRTLADAGLGWPDAFDVNSYHDFGVGAHGLATDLVALATSEDGSIEACRHRSAACIGIMWHPERETPPSKRDLELLRSLLAGATA